MKNKITKNFVLNFIKYLIIFGIIGGILCTGIFYFIATKVEKVDYTSIALNFSSVIYAKDKEGEFVEYDQIYGEQNRLWLDIDKMPDYLPNAFIAIEDERFYKHFGFDIPRTVKASFNYIIRRDSSYGGSTINQQLIKNITGKNERNARRKIIEIFRAIDMDRKLDKDEILELYVNTIYLGQGCNGVETAAKKYFGKSAAELSLAEAASIAGITQYPAKYDPIVNPENNKEKQEIVLKKMYELKMISREEYDQAVSEKLEIQNNEVFDGADKGTHNYFVDKVIDDVLNDLQEELGVSKTVAIKMVYSGGLKIYSTMDRDLQNAVDKVYENPSKYIYYDENDPVQSAIVIMDPSTGEIRALSGGLGEKQGDRILNRAFDSYRQPGSSIKPLTVYGPGFEKNKITPNTIEVDAPFKIGDHEIKNSYSGFRGAMTIRHAIEQSVNTVACKTLKKVGIDTSYNFAKDKMHLSSLENADRSISPLALGGLTKGVSVADMTAAYSVFANNGMYSKPYTYEKVLDNNGKTILEKSPKQSLAMSKRAAQTTLNCLRGVVLRGTGTGASISSTIEIAGKTGTSDDKFDRWFMGVTPYYATGCWVGYDSPKATAKYGSNPAIALWDACMKEALKDLPAKKFDYSSMNSKDLTVAPKPEKDDEDEDKNSVSAKICLDSGLLASENCAAASNGSRVVTKNFPEGEIPKETCTGHQSARIDTTTGMIANPNCPPDAVKTEIVYMPAVSECKKH